jgi:hypothetical protein
MGIAPPAPRDLIDLTRPASDDSDPEGDSEDDPTDDDEQGPSDDREQGPSLNLIDGYLIQHDSPLSANVARQTLIREIDQLRTPFNFHPHVTHMTYPAGLDARRREDATRLADIGLARARQRTDPAQRRRRRGNRPVRPPQPQPQPGRLLQSTRRPPDRARIVLVVRDATDLRVAVRDGRRHAVLVANDTHRDLLVRRVQQRFRCSGVTAEQLIVDAGVAEPGWGLGRTQTDVQQQYVLTYAPGMEALNMLATDRQTLLRKERLTCQVMMSSGKLLRDCRPPGLGPVEKMQDTQCMHVSTLFPDGFRPVLGKTVVYLHCGGNHWVTTDNMEGHVRAWDQARCIQDNNVRRAIHSLWGRQHGVLDRGGPVVKVRCVGLHPQKGGVVCGLRSIAFGREVMVGTPVDTIRRLVWKQEHMHDWLLFAFEDGLLGRFPHTFAPLPPGPEYTIANIRPARTGNTSRLGRRGSSASSVPREPSTSRRRVARRQGIFPAWSVSQPSTSRQEEPRRGPQPRRDVVPVASPSAGLEALRAEWDRSHT